MCGIVGFIGQREEGDLSLMLEALRHRGPDRQAKLLRGRVGLGHARLAIIDLSPTGDQPMTTADGAATIVFNGEIYNFLELARLLASHHYVLRGKSDTEVILGLYQVFGIHKTLKLLSGMFAFALYDHRSEAVYLARDRFGKKPLYVGVSPDKSVVFASELSAITALPDFQSPLDREALALYFFHDSIPAPRTIFRDVVKVSPGECLRYDLLGASVSWRYDEPYPEEVKRPIPEVVTHIDLLLRAAVKKRMISDVPLGVLLSGGLDSSLVTAYASGLSARPIKTFSVAIDNPHFDESSYAREVSSLFGTDHTEIPLSMSEAESHIGTIDTIIDEPLADASIIPTYLLSREVRKSVTVALGGDGGDELFFGYPTFIAEKLARPLDMLPRSIWSFASAVSGGLPVRDGYLPLDEKVRRFLSGMLLDGAARHATWLSSFASHEIPITAEISTVLSIARQFPLPGEGSRHGLSRYYEEVYLGSQVLAKVDRASMASSLEVRAPFLDRELVSYVRSVPVSDRNPLLSLKHLEKLVALRYLPDDVIYRKKQGFGLPIGEWMRGSLRDLIATRVSDPLLELAGVVPGLGRRLYGEHVRREKNNARKLWSLFVLSSWLARHRRSIAF